MDNLIAAIKRLETAVGVALIVFIVAFVFIAALFRWFGFPVAWSIDLAQLLFGWVVFLGADIAMKNDAHIGVDMLLVRLPFKPRKLVMLANYALIGAFLAVIAVYGAYLSVSNFQRLFNTLQISYSFATASVPAGCVLMLITVVHKIRKIAASRDPKIQENVAAW